MCEPHRRPEKLQREACFPGVFNQHARCSQALHNAIQVLQTCPLCRLAGTPGLWLARQVSVIWQASKTLYNELLSPLMCS